MNSKDRGYYLIFIDNFRKNIIILNMKKLLLTLFLTFAVPIFTLAEEEDFSSGGVSDMMKYSSTYSNPYAGQQQVSDEDFQKALDYVKEKQQKKTRKKDRPFDTKNIKFDDNGDYIEETGEGVSLLNVPLMLVNGDGTLIPVGYYKVIGGKDNNKIYLSLYQSGDLIAKVPAIETKHDFDQEEVNFVKIIPYNNKTVQLIFGSVDFNAYTFLKIRNTNYP